MPSYYNHYRVRLKLDEKDPDAYERANSKVLTYVNRFLYPMKFEVLFAALRAKKTMTEREYNAVKATVVAMLYLVNRFRKSARHIGVDVYAPHFVEYIRNDRVGDPVKFLLSMRKYMYRFLFLVGLQHSFGIDWSRLVNDALNRDKPFKHKSYHTVFTNVYVRSLLKVYSVWKYYRTPNDPDYVLGVNDLATKMSQVKQSSKSLDETSMYALFYALEANLPSSTAAIRYKAAEAIDTCADGIALITSEFHDWRNNTL